MVIGTRLISILNLFIIILLGCYLRNLASRNKYCLACVSCFGCANSAEHFSSSLQNCGTRVVSQHRYPASYRHSVILIVYQLLLKLKPRGYLFSRNTGCACLLSRWCGSCMTSLVILSESIPLRSSPSSSLTVPSRNNLDGTLSSISFISQGQCLALHSLIFSVLSI